MKRAIQAKLNYPCIANLTTGACEPQEAEVEVEFGLLNSGKLQYAYVLSSSGYGVYDESSVAAVRLVRPFPPVPAQAVQAGSRGIPLRAKFKFQVTYSTLVRPLGDGREAE